MKKFRKAGCLLAAVMTLGVGASALGACGGDETKGVLNIYIHRAGYGTAWVEDLGEMFTADTGIEVKVKTVADNADLFTKLESGEFEADLCFSSNAVDYYTYTTYNFNGTRGIALEDLTDIYNETLPGETLTMAQKMRSEYRTHNATVRDGETKYYSAPWINGLNGILINGNTWKDEWSEPRTTNELLSLCDTIKNANQVPFIYCLEKSYWGSAIAPVWAAQYMGEAEVKNFNEGKDKDGRQYVPEMLSYDGFLESLKVVEGLLKNDKGYMHEYSKGLNFTNTQVVFLRSNAEDGNIVMMPNGDWIEREMSANFAPGSCDIRFMKLPVVSSLGTKLGITEGELCALIDYIDGTTATEPTFASTKGLTKDDVLSAVRYARKLQPAYAYEHEAFIPSYAEDKDAAKKFLQFMATDRGIEAFVQHSGGYTLPYEYDYLNSAATKDKFSRLQKSTLEIINESQIFEFEMKDRIFALGGVKIPGLNKQSFYEPYLAASEAKDYKDAQTIFLEDYTFQAGRWAGIKKEAGIVS